MPLNIQELAIASDQFEHGGRIPDAHAGDHGNTAPDLTITGVPEGTVELAVIVHDPDAPLPRGFVHWVVYGVAPLTTRLGAGGAYREGPNGAGVRSYVGPQPPADHGTHHYYFWVFALSGSVGGEPTMAEFLDRYSGTIIEQNRLVGTYST